MDEQSEGTIRNDSNNNTAALAAQNSASASNTEHNAIAQPVRSHDLDENFIPYSFIESPRYFRVNQMSSFFPL